jgi:hypothetical protein
MSDLSVQDGRKLLLRNFLKKYKKSEELFEGLVAAVEEMDRTGLTTSVTNFLFENVFKTKKAAYIHANAVDRLLLGLENKKEAGDSIDEDDCRYMIDATLREELEFDWVVYLAEEEGDKEYWRMKAI